jgi:hypothetical protein
MSSRSFLIEVNRLELEADGWPPSSIESENVYRSFSTITDLLFF